MISTSSCFSFSFLNFNSPIQAGVPQKLCYIAHTSPQVHDILKSAFHLSPLFSGKIVLNDKALDNFVEYGLADNDLIGGIEDDTMEALVTIVNFVNEVRVLGFGLDVLQSIVDDIKGDAIARILRDSYASFPSFWAMVNEDDVEDAINFIYSTDELKEEYDGMIKKIRSYHENVQVNARSTMLERIDEGIDIMVISKYNFANLPLSDDALLQSDGTATTTATSGSAAQPLPQIRLQ